MTTRFDGYNLSDLKKTFGKRPGNYHVDPYFFREGMAGKPYFWNDTKRKWELMSVGDLFIQEDDMPLPVRIPVKEANSDL